MNEGGCDPDGRFYCGSMAYDQRPARRLYRLDPDGSVDVVLEHVTVSNGLEWSPDGSRAYYNDTATGPIRSSTTTANRTDRPADVRRDARRRAPRRADRGRRRRRVDRGVQRRRRLPLQPRRCAEEKLAVPARKVTACTFGGEDLDELFITTSQENIDTREDPLAGSLFRAEVGVKGLPVRPFAG